MDLGLVLSFLYLPARGVPNEDERVAHALGVPGLVTEIRTLLHTGQGLSRLKVDACGISMWRAFVAAA